MQRGTWFAIWFGHRWKGYQGQRLNVNVTTTTINLHWRMHTFRQYGVRLTCYVSANNSRRRASCILVVPPAVRPSVRLSVNAYLAWRDISILSVCIGMKLGIVITWGLNRFLRSELNEYSILLKQKVEPHSLKQLSTYNTLWALSDLQNLNRITC